ncbi:FeoB-associated Cys-rich membrane protein [Gemmatimonas aurantiaca]
MSTIIVVLIVSGAVFYSASRVWKAVVASRKPKDGCGSDCGCGH